MYYKLIDTYTVSQPPRNIRVRHVDGSYSDMMADQPFANALEAKFNGYYPLEETEKPEGNYRAMYTMGEECILQSWEKYTPPEEVFEISRSELYRTIEKMGLIVEFKTVLNSSERNKDLFYFATTLLSNDPDLIAGLEAFRQITGLSMDQIKTILSESRPK